MPDVLDTAAELAKVELEVFGPDLARRPDGRPLEDGHGSNYQKAPAAAKARYHALLTLQAHEGKVASLASQLEAAKALLAISRKTVADTEVKAAALTEQVSKDAETAPARTLGL